MLLYLIDEALAAPYNFHVRATAKERWKGGLTLLENAQRCVVYRRGCYLCRSLFAALFG